jgi:hypothetical protein
MISPEEISPSRWVATLANIEALLEDVVIVLRAIDCPGEAERIEAVRLALRVVRLQRAEKIERLGVDPRNGMSAPPADASDGRRR